MFKHLTNKKAQSTLEYAILIIIIIGALLAVQTYIKRGIQGKMKQSSDDIGDQFSPDNTRVVKRTAVSSNTIEEFGGAAGQGVSKTSYAPGNSEKTSTTEVSSIINTSREKW